MTAFEEYVDGTRSNARDVLTRYRPFITVLRTLNSAFESLLPTLGSTGEGAVFFVAMSHAAFLAAVKLAVSGELLPSYMVFRGCLEDALYGFYLFHHPELKPVWMARQQSEAARKKVREEFPIGRMRKFLTEKNQAVGEQFGLVYESTIDFGAHPNALALTAHLAPIEGSTDQIWQYINLTTVDQAMAFRLGAMAGLNALNIFALLFPSQFAASGAGALLMRAHNEFAVTPDPGSEAEKAAAAPPNGAVRRSPSLGIALVIVAAIIVIATLRHH
jgi:hypothetical protein